MIIFTFAFTAAKRAQARETQAKRKQPKDTAAGDTAEEGMTVDTYHNTAAPGN